MTNETKIRFLRIYGILLGIVIVIAGICLMAGCLSIYNSGDQPYSREIVAETFSGIAFPVYLCLAMTILGFVLEFLMPTPDAKPTVEKPDLHILSRLHSSRDLNQCDEGIQNEITVLQKNRKLHSLIRILVLIVASVVFLVYALNGENFQNGEYITDSMINAMYVLIPCLVVSFGYSLFVTIHNEKSLKKEIELMKQAPVSTNNSVDNAEETSSDKKTRIARCAILAISIFFLVYGFISGGTVDVLTKAINICTECIGLG